MFGFGEQCADCSASAWMCYCCLDLLLLVVAFGYRRWAQDEVKGLVDPPLKEIGGSPTCYSVNTYKEIKAKEQVFENCSSNFIPFFWTKLRSQYFK